MSFQKVRLGDIAKIDWGNTSITKASYVSEGYPAYSATGNDGFLSFAEHEKDGIVLSAIGARCGKCFIAKGKWTAIKNTITIFPKLDLVSLEYLFILLNDQKSWRIKGAGQPFITIGVAKEREIILPPLVKQKRITEILEKASSIKVKREQAIAKLGELEKSVFLEMFGDPISNPKKLTILKLKDVGELDRGVSKHRPRNANELLGGIWPLIQTGDVSNCGGYIVDYKQTYSEIGLKQSKLWRSGTLCITIAANIAKTGILTFDACFPDSVVGFTHKESSTVEYVRVWLSFLQKMLEDSAPESAQKNINLAILRELKIPLPNLAEQRKFEKVLKALRVLVNKNFDVSQKIEELYKSLQHQAFTSGFNA